MIRENTICHSGMRAESLPSRPAEVFGPTLPARFVVLEFFHVRIDDLLRLLITKTEKVSSPKV